MRRIFLQQGKLVFTLCGFKYSWLNMEVSQLDNVFRAKWGIILNLSLHCWVLL